MARIDVVMPQMGESIAEGTMSRWLKKVGDEVKRDEPLFEISTDKVDAEIPSPAAGVLAEVLVQEGQTVEVQTVVARLETEKGAAAAAEAPSTPAPAAATEAAATQPAAPSKRDTALSRDADSARRNAAEAPASGAGASFEDRIRTRSSPLVRKMAAEHGVELSSLRGSGIAGRVTRKDLLEHLESGAAQPAAGAGTAAAGAAAPGGAAASRPLAGGAELGGGLRPPVVEEWPGDVVEPMSRIRQLTMEHMTLSRRWNAHVTSFFEIDLTRVARVRAAKRQEFEKQSGEKLTYLPFIIRAVVEGLKAFPVLNAAVRGNEIVYRKQYNVGIAVALDHGLIVPVIRGADELSMTGLTRQLNDLATRARSKKLQPHEVQNATFTITNPGVFGSLMGTPIVPVPTSAILGVGAIEKRPKVIRGVDGEDTIAIRTCAYFSISFDHRIVDGADADRYMAFLKERLESVSEDVL